MKERIKELSEQAGGGTSKWYTDPDVLEYFAELIVKECADICTQKSLDHPNGVASSAVGHCGYLIRQHFGVDK